MSGPLGSSQWMYASGDFEINQSLRFDDASTEYLKKRILRQLQLAERTLVLVFGLNTIILLQALVHCLGQSLHK